MGGSARLSSAQRHDRPTPSRPSWFSIARPAPSPQPASSPCPAASTSPSRWSGVWNTAWARARSAGGCSPARTRPTRPMAWVARLTASLGDWDVPGAAAQHDVNDFSLRLAAYDPANLDYPVAVSNVAYVVLEASTATPTPSPTFTVEATLTPSPRRRPRHRPRRLPHRKSPPHRRWWRRRRSRLTHARAGALGDADRRRHTGTVPGGHGRASRRRARGASRSPWKARW